MARRGWALGFGAALVALAAQRWAAGESVATVTAAAVVAPAEALPDDGTSADAGASDPSRLAWEDDEDSSDLSDAADAAESVAAAPPSLRDPAFALHVPILLETSDASTDADVADAGVVMCALNWTAYREAPAVYPFVEDLIQVGAGGRACGRGGRGA